MKWLKVMLSLIDGNDATCPHCGRHHLEYGYVVLDPKEKLGYGAVWCNDCHHAFSLSRIRLREEDDVSKIRTELPKGLVFG